MVPPRHSGFVVQRGTKETVAMSALQRAAVTDCHLVHDCITHATEANNVDELPTAVDL